MATLNDKIKALAKFKGVAEAQVEYKGSTPDYPEKWDEYEVDGETYAVMTEDEADDALYDDIENFIDELGITGFTPDFQDWIVDNACNSDFLEDYAREDYELYAQDIESETGTVGATRLIDECIENGIISEADLDENGEYTGTLDLAEALGEYIFNEMDEDYNGNWVEWAKDQFGDEWVNDLARNGQLNIDVQAVVDEIKDWDGYGNNLARYDGRENIENDLYIFRQD